MSYSQLLSLRALLTDIQYEEFINYLSTLSPSSKIRVSTTAANCKIDSSLISKAFQTLCKDGILKHTFAIKCPDCNLLLEEVEGIPDIDTEKYCYNCDESVEISSDDIDVIYTFIKYPFINGQHTEVVSGLSGFVVQEVDSLTHLVKNNELDFNSLFYLPTDDDYELLQELYNNVFKKHPTTKQQGDTLEELVVQLFSLCKHFRVSPIRTETNQIDCYVRNKLYIPGISDSSCIDSYVIECKNEATKPKGGYISKLHSILKTSGKTFGIIASKMSAPKTFISLSNKIFLRDNIIIISVDKADLQSIIYDRENLLECIERKIDEVKLQASQELVEYGLYKR